MLQTEIHFIEPWKNQLYIVATINYSAVYNSYRTLSVEKNVFWLQVAVNDAVRV